MYVFKIKIFYEVIKMNENIMNALNAINETVVSSREDVKTTVESYVEKTNQFNSKNEEYTLENVFAVKE